MNWSCKMNGRSMLIVCSAVIFSGIAFTATPSLAQKTAKACEEEWKANKAENQAKKITEKAYVEKCRAESGKPAAATTPAAAPAKPAQAPAAATPAAAPAKPAQTPAAATPKSAPEKPATAAVGTNQYTTAAQAKLRCPLDTVVWVNLSSKIYHFAGHKDYGNTKNGAYMCEKDTAGAGARAAKDEKHP
jgi:hypothetical protein